MKKNTIKINGKEYVIKYTLRALFIFEQITKRPFKIETLLDNYVFLYSIILANNSENLIDWNEFIDALDNDPKIYNQLNDVVNQTTKIDDLLSGDEKDDGEQKKS